VREFAEVFLKARGEWDALWGAYVAERSVDGGEGATNRRSRTTRTAKRRP
jgi:hypothetical protein